MSAIQWQMCYLNVIEDERDTYERIKSLVEVAVNLFTGGGGEEAPQAAETATPVVSRGPGTEPDEAHPDIRYTVAGTNVEVHKIMSTEYDKILEEEAKKSKGKGDA